MQAIGGYFELADYEQGKGFPHQGGILLNTGRNALEYILRCIGKVRCIYLPYYTCEVVLEPLKRLHIPYIFYHINAMFELVEDIHLKEGEYIIANNYFGLKDAYIKLLAEKYGEHLIVDCAQAFFAKPISGIKSFYSTRKFVGVADGGIAVGIQDSRAFDYEEDDSTFHSSHLLTRKKEGAEAGFRQYQENELKLENLPVRRMSCETQDILSHINYERIIAQRRSNFKYLHEALNSSNCLHLPSYESFSCPMVYPYMGKTNQDLRKELIKNKVFVARYWPNVLSWVPINCQEFLFAEKLIPLPIDQRYGEEEMKYIVTLLSTKNRQAFFEMIEI